MKKKRSHVYRGAAGIFLALMVILGVVAQVADNWADKVNELLGASSATIKRSEKQEDYRFPSDYANASDLIVDEIEFNTRLAAEGTVALKGMPELPGKKVTLFGMRSGDKMQFGGSMGELVSAAETVNLARGMANSGFEVNPAMVQFYKDHEADYAPTRSAGGNIVSAYTNDAGENDQGAAVGEVPVSEYSADLLGDYKDAAVIVLDQGNASSAQNGEAVNGSRTWQYDSEVSYAFGYGVEGSAFAEEITATNSWAGIMKCRRVR